MRSNTTAPQTLKYFAEIVKENIPAEVWGYENKDKIINMGENIISLHYTGSCGNGAREWIFFNYATIDLTTGELVPFTNYFSKENVKMRLN